MKRYHALVKNPSDGEVFFAAGGPLPSHEAAEEELTRIQEAKGFEVLFVDEEKAFEALALNLLKGLGKADPRVWSLDQLEIQTK